MDNFNNRLLQLKIDLRDMGKLIDTDIDAYIGSFNAKTQEKREILKVVHKYREKELFAFAREMSKKYERK